MSDIFYLNPCCAVIDCLEESSIYIAVPFKKFVCQKHWADAASGTMKFREVVEKELG